MTKHSKLILAFIFSLLLLLPDIASAQTQQPTKFSRQFKIDRKSDQLLSNNSDTPREARNDRRKRRAKARNDNRKPTPVQENRTASQDELSAEKRTGRRERQSRDSRSRQRARNAPSPVETMTGSVND